MDEIVNASSAAIGQVVGTFASFPLDVAKTKLQATRAGNSPKVKVGLINAYVGQENLLRMYWQKFPTKALQQGSSRFTYYFIYAFLRNRYLRWVRTRKIGYIANILLGYFAAIINVIFLAPMESVATRVLVADASSSSGYDSSGPGMLAVARDIYRHHGIRGFYFGWTSTFYSAMNPAIQNTVFDQFRERLLRGRGRLGFVESFTLGAVRPSHPPLFFSLSLARASYRLV